MRKKDAESKGWGGVGEFRPANCEDKNGRFFFEENDFFGFPKAGEIKKSLLTPRLLLRVPIGVVGQEGRGEEVAGR